MERKLATIRVISDIQPIDGADKIELVIVDGWKVVVAKEVGHKVGDMVVYCEIDSYLPVRGQISQGLILPLSLISYTNIQFEVGMDVTNLLGIVKYEPPIPAELAGKVKGLFPSFIRKTDEERIQNLSSEYDELKNHTYYVTEKLDGSSATFYIKDGEFGVCSRNLELLETEGNTFWKVARELDLENKMRSVGENFSLQGELIGESVQGNPYKIKGQSVRFFNVFDIDEQEYRPLSYFKIILDVLKLTSVPILDEKFTLPDNIDDLLLYADSKSALNPNFDREGVVVRSLDRKISFKIISNKFLLNEK
mgnify:CR=1 FL=1